MAQGRRHDVDRRGGLGRDLFRRPVGLDLVSRDGALSAIGGAMTSSAIRHNPASVWRVPDGFKSIYSHAVEVEEGARTLFISGQVGVAPDGTLPAGFALQLDQAMDNVEALLAAAGMTKADVVKANYFLTRAADLPNFWARSGAGAGRRASLRRSPSSSSRHLRAPNI